MWRLCEKILQNRHDKPRSVGKVWHPPTHNVHCHVCVFFIFCFVLNNVFNLNFFHWTITDEEEDVRNKNILTKP